MNFISHFDFLGETEGYQDITKIKEYICSAFSNELSFWTQIGFSKLLLFYIGPDD